MKFKNKKCQETKESHLARYKQAVEENKQLLQEYEKIESQVLDREESLSNFMNFQYKLNNQIDVQPRKPTERTKPSSGEKSTQTSKVEVSVQKAISDSLDEIKDQVEEEKANLQILVFIFVGLLLFGFWLNFKQTDLWAYLFSSGSKAAQSGIVRLRGAVESAVKF